MVDLNLKAGSRITQLAVVMDVRSRGFTGDLDLVRNDLGLRNINPRVLFLEATDDILVRRYENNRRDVQAAAGQPDSGRGDRGGTHHAGPGQSDGRSDHRHLEPVGPGPAGEHREDLPSAEEGFPAPARHRVESFGFKYGLPMDADMVMDVQFLPNPHWVDELRPQTGQSPAVQDYVLSQAGADEFLQTYTTPAAAPGRRRLQPGGQAVHDRRHQLQRKTPQRCDRRGARRIAGTRRAAVGSRPASGSGAGMTTPAGRSEATRGSAERIVALGGGHGLYAALSAARRLTPYVTAVVTVADDGGSSGRLRAELDVVPPGDLRMALAALASDSPHGRLWATIIQHRFGGSGRLAGHPIETCCWPDSTRCSPTRSPPSTSSAGSSASKGRVLPMCPIALQIEADVAGFGG